MSLVQPITPHLWFDKEAKEAAGFYCSVFPDSKIDAITQLHDTPSGDCDVVSFTLQGQPFMAISAAHNASRCARASGSREGSKLTKNDTDGLNLNSGPALIAMNG